VEKRQRSFPLETHGWNGFGKFLVRHKSGILRKIPLTGETILTKDKRKIRFVGLRSPCAGRYSIRNGSTSSEAC